MSFKEAGKEVNIEPRNVLKVKLKDRSASGELKVLFLEKTIVIRGERITLRNWVCEEISGNIPVNGYYEAIRSDKDGIVVDRLRIRDLTRFAGKHVFYVRGFIK